ncbi:MAG: hypothetical protein LRY27_02685, partial [Chitinophagales bacterium]|nr:hypothetical protein [Chitinophagales bacterium]
MSKIIEMTVPNLAESITEVTLAQWLVKDGDYVEIDQAIVEMETDKASQELFAEQSGKITLIANEGDDLPIGALICKIDTGAEAPAKKEEAKQEVKKEEPKAAEPKKEEAKKEEAKPDVTDSYTKGTPSPAAAKIASEHNINPAFIA